MVLRDVMSRKGISSNRCEEDGAAEQVRVAGWWWREEAAAVVAESRCGTERASRKQRRWANMERSREKAREWRAAGAVILSPAGRRSSQGC
jgi:hypothetical protein